LFSVETLRALHLKFCRNSSGRWLGQI
jgi:hypothetical protein